MVCTIPGPDYSGAWSILDRNGGGEISLIHHIADLDIETGGHIISRSLTRVFQSNKNIETVTGRHELNIGPVDRHIGPQLSFRSIAAVFETEISRNPKTDGRSSQNESENCDPKGEECRRVFKRLLPEGMARLTLITGSIAFVLTLGSMLATLWWRKLF